MHPTVRALFDVPEEPGDRALWRALTKFFFDRVAQFTYEVRELDEIGDFQVKNRGADRLTVFGYADHFGGGRHFWLDVMRDPEPGLTAKWVLYYGLDDRTRAGKEAARNPWSIERPQDHDWRAIISNDEVAQDAEAE